MFHFFHLMRRVVGIHSGRDMSDEMMNFFVRDFVALFLCFFRVSMKSKKKLIVWSFLQHMQHMRTTQNTNNILSLIIRIT